MALIELRGLTKYYRMGDSIVRALDGADLNIERGEFIAITGPSGSGKSTMMHLLGCLDRPTSGSYILNGRRVSDMSLAELAVIRNREIGFVFQTFNLINRTTAIDNVGIPLFYARRANTRGPAVQALERVGLAHRGGHRPSELSGGERQRVAIARAIVNNPAFLLADEPTGNLDSRTGEAIMSLFHSLNQQGVTIVLVTHEPDVAIQARRIVQMRDGKIVADRPTDEFLREQGVSARPGQSISIVGPGPDVSLDVRPHAPVAFASPAANPGDSFSAGVAPRQPPSATDQGIADRAATSGLPPQPARGATASLIVACSALFAAVAAQVSGSIVMRMYPGVQALVAQRDPNIWKDIPSGYWLGVMGAFVGVLLALVLGLIAVLYGFMVLRTARRTPGNWIHLGRARKAIGVGCFSLLFAFLGQFVTQAVAKLFS